VVERFGADRFMVNSDFPHGLGGAGEGMVDVVKGLEKLSASEKEQLLGLSACALFGIDPATRKQIRRQGL
jgi:predicted TIM-barrel fold metal-dependent hydrolase